MLLQASPAYMPAKSPSCGCSGAAGINQCCSLALSQGIQRAEGDWPAIAGVPPALAHAAVHNLAGLLIGGGLFLLGLAACVFCITAIPTIRVTSRSPACRALPYVM